MKPKYDAQKVISDFRSRQALANLYSLALGVVAILLLAGVLALLTRDQSPAAPTLLASQPPLPTEDLSSTSTQTANLVSAETLAPGLGDPPLPDAPSPTPIPSVYVVRFGDTLESIARQFNIDLPALLALNPGIDQDLISVGQEILVPSRTGQPAASTPVPEDFRGLVEYQVVAGDTLLEIASRFNTTVDAIVAENDLENANDIRAGDTLKIPTNQVTPGAATPAPTPAPSPTPG